MSKIIYVALVAACFCWLGRHSEQPDPYADYPVIKTPLPPTPILWQPLLGPGSIEGAGLA